MNHAMNIKMNINLYRGLLIQYCSFKIRWKTGLAIKIRCSGPIFWYGCLKGELQEEFLDQIDFPAYGISFDGKDFIVVLFYLNSYGYSYELSQFILQNVFEEIINRELKGYMVEVDEMMACIINGTGNTEEEMLDFLEFCYQPDQGDVAKRV